MNLRLRACCVSKDGFDECAFRRGRRVTTSQGCRLLVAFACLVTLAGTACRRSIDSSQDISIKEKITPQPVRVGEAEVSVQLADRTANPVTGASIMVEEDMDHPGMSPAFKTANETAPGHYLAQISFDMGGDWVVLLHIKLANGRRIERQMDVRGVRSN
jgi:hypothetical protein